jgi:citrate synthase
MPVTAKGLEGIVANSTRLSDVIGDKGQLIYSGYDINELAGKGSFKEGVYLLWKGKLPNRQESEHGDTELTCGPGRGNRLHQGAPKTAGPMDVCAPLFRAWALYRDGQGGDA